MAQIEANYLALKEHCISVTGSCATRKTYVHAVFRNCSVCYKFAQLNESYKMYNEGERWPNGSGICLAT